MTLRVPAALASASEDKVRAILEILFYMARADGVFADEELAYFLRVAEPISNGRVTAAHLGVAVGEWSKRSGREIEERITQLARLFDDSYEKEMVCNLAAQLAEVDDAVLVPEQYMLDFLGRTFFP